MKNLIKYQLRTIIVVLIMWLPKTMTLVSGGTTDFALVGGPMWNMPVNFDTIFINTSTLSDTLFPKYDWYVNGTFIGETFAVADLPNYEFPVAGNYSIELKSYINEALVGDTTHSIDLGNNTNVITKFSNLNCKPVFWSNILQNMTSFFYNNDGLYINKWTLDTATFIGFYLPGFLIVQGDGNHHFIYSIVNKQTFQEVGHTEGSFTISPIAIKTSEGNQACPGEQINFYVDGPVSSVNWDFGDGSPVQYINNTNHVYNIPDIYTVKAAYFMCESNDTAVFTININNSATPVPEIMINNGNTFCPSDNITFNSAGNFNSYEWNFGDGSTGSGINVAHSYAGTGTYNVSLQVQNKCGFTGKSTDSVIIQNNVPAFASFTPNPLFNMACNPYPIQFIANGSGSFSWDFGDSTYDNGQSVIHEYPSNQTYFVKLSVQNACGDTASVVNMVYASSNESPKLNVNLNPEWNNNGNQLNDTIILCPGKTIRFDNNSQNSEPVTYEWYVNSQLMNTGDNSYDLFSDVTGNYTLTLVAISNFCQHRDSASWTVIFTDTIKPNSSLGEFPPRICPGELAYFFDNQGNNNPNQYVYSIGFSNGDTINGITTYSDTVLGVLYTGNFNQSTQFTFKVTNNCNNSLTLTDSVIVSDNPANIPFYYVSNSTVSESGILVSSQRQNPSDMEVDVKVSMPSWSGGDTTFYLFFIKDSLSPNNQPSGKMKFSGIGIQAGVNVQAFVGYDASFKKFGVAAGYYCDHRMVTEDRPDITGAPTQLSFPFVPGGQISLSDITLPPLTCNPTMIKGTWYGNYNGTNVVVKFNRDSSYNINSQDGKYNYSAGRYSYVSPTVYNLIDTVNCKTSAIYTIYPVGDTLVSSGTDYICYDRSNVLNTIKLIKGFNKDDNTSCPGDKVQFKIAGTTNPEWHFGDGSTSTELYPIHAYASIGKYKAFVKVKNTCGRTDTIYTIVKVANSNKPPMSYININNPNAKVGDIVYFNAYNNGSNPNLKYQWFDNGKSFGNTQKVQYSFINTGEHNISLVTSNGCGSDTSFQFLYIQDNSCFANFTVTMVNDSTFTFEAAQKGAQNYHWDLNDGTYFDTASSIITHVYSMVGTYNVSLIETQPDNSYCNYSYSLYIKGDCRANFQILQLDTANLFVKVKNLSVKADQVDWYFGGEYVQDNSTTVSYSFSYPGVYQIIQQVSNSSNNCNDTISQYIVLPDTSCQAYFDAITMDNKTVSFQGYSYTTTDKVLSWKWDFGDNSTGAGQIVSHQYAKVGYYTVTLNAKGSYCKSTETNWAYAQGMPCDTPVFVKSKVDSMDFNFFVKNPKTGVEYSWDFGDGSNYATGNTVSHQYNNEGIFYININANDSVNGCYQYYSDTVKIGNVGCWSYFGYNNDSANHIQFYNYSSPGKYYWDFGDGYFSRAFEPDHNYKTTNVYTVCLTESDSSGGCTQKECYDIVAGKISCKADFSFTVDTVTGNVSFKDISSGSPNSFYWDFGDWNYSEDENPVNPYANPGVYSVYFSIYNDITGCSDEIYKDVSVGNTKTLTKADFSWYIEGNNKTVDFTDGSSSNVTGWYWTFGDGTYKADQNVSHDFDQPGSYNVCLTVFSDNDGTSDNKCVQIVIGQGACSVVSEFSYFIDSKTDSVKFTDKSKGDFDVHYWNFGDGVTSSDINPSHQYSKAGFYLVSLAVKKLNSTCSDFSANFLQVGTAECHADFDYVVNSNNIVTFSNKSKADNPDYYWAFDDGGFSTDTNPSHPFIEGLHYASLTVSTGLCMDYTEQEVQVGKVTCSAKFSYYVNIPQLKAYCKNEAIGKSTEYFWLFGDGSVSNDTNPSHVFPNPGYYTISLNTFDATNNCMDYYEAPVLIGNEGIDCLSDFNYVVNNLNVKFSDNSKGKIEKYFWDYGEENVPPDLTNTPTPNHTYNSGGYYNVCHSVVNDNNVPNMKCKWVQVATDNTTNCKAKFIYTIDSLRKTATFIDKSIGNPTSYEWDFGDLSAKSTQKPPISHTYSAIGKYVVSLTINTATGCQSSDYKLVNASNKDSLMVGFGSRSKPYSKKSGGYPVDFIGVGLGDQSRLRWSFGDSTTDTTTTTPIHNYVYPGTKHVCYQVSDPITGQSDSVCKDVSTTTHVYVPVVTANKFELTAYPNPFNNTTTITYELINNSVIELAVYDLTGRNITTLVNASLEKGRYSIQWDGSGLDNGIYILQLKSSEGNTKTKILVKQK